MKYRFLLLVLLFCAVNLGAQEQAGIVKTVGRPGQPGQPLEDVAVRVRGTEALSVSDEDGKFLLSLAHYALGQAYSLSRVSRPGYQLADAGLIGRRFPYSDDIPLEISMVSTENYYRTRSEIEAQIRAKVDSEYESRMAGLLKDMENQVISAEAYKAQRDELLDYYDNVDNLVGALADRYARTDYDRMDSLDCVINHLIEQGRIEEADALIDEKDTKRELMQIRENNRRLSQTLEEGKKAEALKVQEYAGDLKRKFEIASLRFDNHAAAGFLHERMSLDSTKVEWKLDYASFIRDYLGRYDEALAIYQDELETATDAFLEAELYGCIGAVYTLLGEYDEALESYKKGVALRDLDVSARPLLATSYYNIGSIYLSKDMYEEAVAYLDKAKLLCEEFQDSLGLSSVYSAMAVRYADAGEFEKAEDNYQKALKIRVTVLGENDLTVASIHSNLGILNQRLNRYPQAYEHIGKAKDINIKILGEHHPEVADDYLLLGALEIETGNHANALQYYQIALDVQNDFYRGDHPDIAHAYNKLAYYYDNVERDIQKTLYYYEKSYEMLKAIYGRMHADVALALNNLAVAYSDMAQYDKALECHDDALDIRMSLYGENHYSVADTYNNITSLYSKLGKYIEARTFAEKALAIYRACYGEEHSNVALAYNNLGSILRMLGQDQDALDNHGRSVEIYKKIYGEDHHSLAVPYDNIGLIYYDYKMIDQAEAYLDEALRIRLASYGENHSSVAQSYNNLSQLYQAKGEYEKSEELLLKVETIMSDIYGSRHPEVATAIANLSTLYMERNDLDKALDCNLRALSIVEENYPSDHPTVMLYRYGVANIYFNAGEYKLAIPYMASVHRDSYEKKGPDDKYTVHYFMYLHQMYMEAMKSASYDGSLDKSFAELNRNTIITATVAQGSPAEQRGLHGTYLVMSYEDWTMADEDTNFLIYKSSVTDRSLMTYVLYRDGEFMTIPFEGRLGIHLIPRWISSEEKSDMMKTFKKWHRKNVK